MNKIILVFYCLILFSCKKSSIPPPNAQPINFEIVGLNDTSIYQTDTLEYNVTVNYLSGSKEKVVLFVSGLPSTMSAGFYPELDTPSYFSTIRLVAHNVDTGTYNIIIGASSSALTKNYNVRVKIKPNPVNPAAVLVGTYVENGLCSISNTIQDTVIVTSVNPYFNKINIQGLWTGNNAINVKADIDPITHSVTIPFQQIGNQSFSGSGTYNNTSITINYLVTDGLLFSDNCSTLLTKQ